jgi:chromosome segregation ATPase
MSDAVLIAVVGLLSAFLSGGGVLAYVALKKSKTEIKVLDSQEKTNLATALDTASGTLIKALTFAQAEREIFEKEQTAFETEQETFKARIDTLEKTTGELTARKEERELQIRSMEYDIKNLQLQVKDWEMKYTELEGKYSNSRKAIEILVQALQDAHISLPPGLELLLGDSIAKFKWPRGDK